MIHTKLQASDARDSEEEDVLIFFLRISVVQTQEPLARGHFRP